MDSIKNQSYENFKAVFVDDGNKYKTEEITKGNIKNDELLKYIYKENGCVTSS